MPKGYEHLVERVLKTNIYEELDPEDRKFGLSSKTRVLKKVIDKQLNVKGIPQGGILSPLWMNWALNGLQHYIKEMALKRGRELNLYSIDRAKMQRNKDIVTKQSAQSESYYRNRNRIEWYNTTWFVRYADDFLVGTKSEKITNLLREDITKFLSLRGLCLSENKTKVIP